MIAVLVNPQAGYGKPLKYLQLLEGFCLQHKLNLNIYKTQQLGDTNGISNWLKNLVNLRCMVLIGGDGTLNDFVNAIDDGFIIPILILPAGSGNDFAETLYGKTTISILLNKLLDHKIQKVDRSV